MCFIGQEWWVGLESPKKNCWWGSRTERLVRWPEGVMKCSQPPPKHASVFLGFLFWTVPFSNKTVYVLVSSLSMLQTWTLSVVLKIDVKTRVPFGPLCWTFCVRAVLSLKTGASILLDFQSIEIKKWLFSFPHKTRLTLSICKGFSPVLLHPPGLQMSRLARVPPGLHFKGVPLENGSHGRELQGRWAVKASRAGHYVKAALQKGLHNESASKNLRLASVIDERFIVACWSAASVTWRRPANLCYGHAQVCAHAVQVYASILTSAYRYRCVFLVFWLPI